MEQSSYDAVHKKYNLPDFQTLDAEFDICSVEGETGVLRNICKKIRERLESVIDIVERVLQPDPNSYVNMYECRSLTGSEKDALFLLFKQIMHSYRELLKFELLNDEKSYAEFIKRFSADWQNVKMSLVPFFDKLTVAWKETKKDKEKLEYLG